MEMSKEIETRGENLFSQLVPVGGQCETLEGEMLRAINRIVYRCYNDGDKFYTGYGVETAGSSALFLMEMFSNMAELKPALLILEKLDRMQPYNDNEYEVEICKVYELIVLYIESRNCEYRPNTIDSTFDYHDVAMRTWDANDGYEDEDGDDYWNYNEDDDDCDY